jgi:alpha-N-acetylglucosamine transferase
LLFIILLILRAQIRQYERLKSSINWSQYAYFQHAMDPVQLCNSIMMFDALNRTGARASKVSLYPGDWKVDGNDEIGRLLGKARDHYGAQLSHIPPRQGSSGIVWTDGFSKLLAFNQTRFRRVISLDSDGVLGQNMDELFLMPPTPVAMPHAYWSESLWTFFSHLTVIKPSTFGFSRVQRAIGSRQTPECDDMAILNNLYGKHCTGLPRSRYNLRSSEFRDNNHMRYLAGSGRSWDPDRALSQARYIHFSDEPFPKPWLPHNQEHVEESQPACQQTELGQVCRDREIWLGLYAGFAKRREVCLRSPTSESYVG